MKTSINFQVVEKLILTNKFCDENKLISGLKGEKMKNMIIPIRNLIAEGKKEEADALKKSLPAILVSGRFSGGRAADKLVSYSKILCLDLDKIASEKLNELKDTVSKCPYTFITFISPSGSGLKILIRVSSGSNYHRDAYKQVMEYYSKLLKEKFDEKTCDVSRLTYMSYDPDPYHYPDSEVFQVKTPITEVYKPILAYDDNLFHEKYREIYEYAYHYTENKQKYEDGNRNNFLFLLACNCNRYGVPKEALLRFVEWCELNAKEIKAAVDSGYKRTENFGTWKMKINEQGSFINKDNGKPKYEDVVKNTPIIPTEIKEKLPAFLTELIGHFTDDRQCDMALTTLLSLLSGVINTTSGVYNNVLLYPALSSMITAPSGSGKSVTGVIQRLFLCLHFQLLKEAEHPNGLFMPDNTSTTALIKRLADNHGIGVLFSTDLGFLGHVLKRDTAVLQAIIRAAHSGEIFNEGRSTKRNTKMVISPRLAACLSATPQEFKYLFTANEDGLISRFIHYCFIPERNWQDIKATGVVEYKERLEKASNKILNLHSYIREKSMEFNLTEEQLLAINEWLQQQNDLAATKENWAAINPIIKRTGQMIFKLSMVVATLRAWEKDSQAQELFIDDDDFDLVMKLNNIYFQHSASIVNYVVEDSNQEVDGQAEKLLFSLPDTFKRKEAIEVAKKIGLRVSERTVDNWLKNFVETGILSNNYNNYSKLSQEDVERLKQAA